MDASPLGIILVKNGSRGDRLLFKYPYIKSDGNLFISKAKKHNPYSNVGKGHFEDINQKVSDTSKGNLLSFPDKVLSNLLAMERKQCGTKFELKVDDVRFVGHPVNLEEGRDFNQKSSEGRNQGFSIAFFNIVFALKAAFNHDIVNCYYELSRRLGICLNFEERRCGFLSQEARLMLNTQDETSQQPESSQESYFDVILRKSLLANHLRQIYQELCEKGQVMLQLNYWLGFSFCLPPKIPGSFTADKRISNDALQACLKNVKPYHTFLLCVDKQDLLQSLPSDASPALRRLLFVESPVTTFYTLAADADLTLGQVLMLAGHLVYWGKAVIIYPICNTNVYVLAPQVPTGRQCKLAEEFELEFAGQSYHQTLAQFSLPITFWHLGDPITPPLEQQLQKQTFLWLLKRGLLQQIHTYIYIAPTTVIVKPKPGLSSGHSSARSQLATVCEALSEKSAACPEDPDFFEGVPRSRKFSVRQKGSYSNPSSRNSSNSDFQKGGKDSESTGLSHLKDSQSSYPHFYLGASGQDDIQNGPFSPHKEQIVSSSQVNPLQTPSESDVASVCSDDRSLSPGISGVSLTTEEEVHNCLDSCLTSAEKEIVLNTEASKNLEDLKLFARLCPYFRGKHHLEEIMYKASLHRAHLLEILDKFKSVLVTTEHADHSISFTSEK